LSRGQVYRPSIPGAWPEFQGVCGEHLDLGGDEIIHCDDRKGHQSQYEGEGQGGEVGEGFHEHLRLSFRPWRHCKCRRAGPKGFAANGLLEAQAGLRGRERQRRRTAPQDSVSVMSMCADMDSPA